MKLIEKEKKGNKITLADVEKDLQTIQRQLGIECTQCDGTGKLKTKNGELPKGEHGSDRCATCKGSGTLGRRLDAIQNDIANIRKELSRIKSTLNTHINKQSVEIRMLPDGHNPDKHGYHRDYSNKSLYTDEQIKKLKWENGWVDYSGKFDLDSGEEMSIVIGKAVAHFERYFKDGFYHSNKRLGIFLTSPTTSGRKLIEEFQTEE